MRFRPEPRAPICPHKDHFIGATQEVVPNPTYAEELRDYDVAYRKFVQDHEQWRKDKETFDEQNERDLYLRLHAKYGKPSTAEQELIRIKEGIKRNIVTTIVDGNDMLDWGWITIESHNHRMREKLKEQAAELKKK